jgi:hypothetical protein
MRLKFIICIILLTGNLIRAQYIEKNWLDKTDSVYGYYTTILPASTRIQAVLILLDGYGGNADNFLSQTKIHNVAWANDILTVCIPTGNRLYLDQSMISLLNRVLKEIIKKYNLREDQFAIGGMSSGGAIALRYTELCYEKPTEFPIRPKAVFDVDSPLDFLRLYKSSERDLKKNHQGWWLDECRMIIDRLKKEIGDPYTEPENYKAISPFLNDAKDSLNEKYLAHIAVRTYHDVNPAWYIQNRQRSIYETNMLDGSELINRLVVLGNTQAEFIASKIPGRRSNGQFHPHSWNIADETDLVQWIKEKLNFYPDHISSPYSYKTPLGWTAETILFPMDFAPALVYKGFEDLRFAPGWGNAASGEKWAYTFLWWLDNTYNFNETILQQNMETYFTGLTRLWAVAAKLDLSIWKPAKFKVQQIKTSKGDKMSFTATGTIFDSQVTKKPGVLYVKIHVRDCGGKNKTTLLFEIAGSSFAEPVWQSLDQINEDFRCEK